MKDRDDLICVATTSNPALAHVWRNALETEGIECHVGEYLTYWLDHAPWAQAELWVHAAQADQARDLLAHHLPHHAVSDEWTVGV